MINDQLKQWVMQICSFSIHRSKGWGSIVSSTCQQIKFLVCFNSSFKMVMPKCAKVVSQLTSVVEYVLQKEKGYRYECDMLSLFELGSVHHDYYLVNIKVPVEPYSDVNMKIGKLEDMSLVVLTFRTIIKSVQWIVHLTLNRSVSSLSHHQTLLLFS